MTILICEIAGYLGKSPAREWEVHRQRMFGEIRLYCALCRVGAPRRVWSRACERIPAWHGKFRRSRGTEQPLGRQLQCDLTLERLMQNSPCQWFLTIMYVAEPPRNKKRSIPCTTFQKMSPSDAKKGRLTSVGVPSRLGNQLVFVPIQTSGGEEFFRKTL